MISFERQAKILALLKQHECVTVDFICERIYASPSTVRRDIARMCEDKLLLRVRGGAAVLEGSGHDAPSLLRFSKNVDKKKKIASLAMRYIKNASTLFLDSSSTTAYLAGHLDSFQDLSVVTNGIQALNTLNERTQAKVFPCGGYILNNSSIVGSEAEKTIRTFRADIAFFSCVGFTLEGGAMDALPENSAIKREMMAHARKRILLCDSTKFGQEYFCKICDTDEIDLVITDAEPPEEIREALSYKLVIAFPPGTTL